MLQALDLDKKKLFSKEVALLDGLAHPNVSCETNRGLPSATGSDD